MYSENLIPDSLAERCLMHQVGNAVLRAYQHSDLLEQRRSIMQHWADYLLGDDWKATQNEDENQ